jgi:hypothetical protein
MNLTISLRRASNASDLWFVNHDLQPRGGVNGLPETNKCLTDAFFPVSPQLLAVIQAVERLLNPDLNDSEFEHEFGGLFRDNAGFSNQHGIESGDFRIENLYCGGATFQAVGGDLLKAAGALWLQVYAIDPNDPPAIPQTLAGIDMRRWFFPTTALTNASNPFPNFNGRCLIPFLGVGGLNYIAWNNPDREDKVGVVQVPTIQIPFLPAHPEKTAGLI